jgi:Flp pilus assembly protein TadB
MNKYEQRSFQERKSTMKVGLSIFTAVAVLLFVVLVMTGYIGSIPTQPWQKAAVILAAVVLVFRQVGRIARRNTKPKVDPQSALHLNE